MPRRKPTTTVTPAPASVCVYSIDSFCDAHTISRSELYRLWGQGLGPRYVHLKRRRLITAEDASEWRASLRPNPPEKWARVPEKDVAA
jgi:hypothetical protein